MFRSIKTKLLFSQITPVLLITSILGISSYLFMTDFLSKTQEAQLEYIAQSQANLLTLRLQDMIKTFEESIAKAKSVEIYGENYQEALLIEYFQHVNLEFPVLAYVNPRGQEEIKLINGQKSSQLFDLSKGHLFQKIIRNPNRGFVFFTELPLISTDDFKNTYFLDFGFGVKNFFDEFKGAIIGRVPLTALIKNIQKFRFGETGFLLLIDQQGIILSYPQKNKIFQKINISGEKSAAIFSRFKSKGIGVERAVILDIDAYIAYTPVKETNWSLMAVLPYQEFMSAPHTLRNIIISRVSLTILGLIFLSLWVANSIIRPIARLSAAIEMVAHGDLTQKVDIPSQDEIGMLSEYFNQMTTDLKESRDKLIMAAEELKESNEEVKSFAYIVSHDLRAPLVNIKGFAGELTLGLKEIESIINLYLPDLEARDKKSLMAILSQDIPEALNFINSSVNRMDGLINSVLKLSRLGRQELNPQSIDMTNLIQSILKSMTHQLEQHLVKVSIGNLPLIIADRTAIEQIMGNLLDNAVKYLDPNRPGEIEITAEQTPEKITFHLRDNGRGMSKEDIPRIFEIFRRAGKQDVPGEGMGLAYVKALIRRHGGRIWCESELGVGTDFYFTLPIGREQ